MVQADWGLKRVCHACGTRFYDFHKAKIVCPDCGEEFDPEQLLVGKRRVAAKEEPEEEIQAAEPEAAVTDEAETEGSEFELEEDVSLGDTSDDTILVDDDEDVDSNDLGVETFTDGDDEDDS